MDANQENPPDEEEEVHCIEAQDNPEPDEEEDSEQQEIPEMEDLFPMAFIICTTILHILPV